MTTSEWFLHKACAIEAWFYFFFTDMKEEKALLRSQREAVKAMHEKQLMWRKNKAEELYKRRYARTSHKETP